MEHEVCLNELDSDLTLVLQDERLSAATMTATARDVKKTPDGFAMLWSGCRANYGINLGRIPEDRGYCFEISITEEFQSLCPKIHCDHQARVGWSTSQVLPRRLGEGPESFALGTTGKKMTNGEEQPYTGEWGLGDTVLCTITSSAVAFWVNGSACGEAFAIPKSFRTRTFFPHILLKNVKVKINFGHGALPNSLSWPKRAPPPPFVFLDVPLRPPPKSPRDAAPEDTVACVHPEFHDKEIAVPITDFVFTAPEVVKSPRSDAADCFELVMLIGLPGAGKTTWVKEEMQTLPEFVNKDYYVLSPSGLIDDMKDMVVPPQANREQQLLSAATRVYERILKRAPKIPRNYVIDQTNVYEKARLLKMKPFKSHERKAVVFLPHPEVLKRWRSEKESRDRNEESRDRKTVPVKAIKTMMANFTLPRATEKFSEVKYESCSPDEAESRVLLYHATGKTKQDQGGSERANVVRAKNHEGDCITDSVRNDDDATAVAISECETREDDGSKTSLGNPEAASLARDGSNVNDTTSEACAPGACPIPSKASAGTGREASDSDDASDSISDGASDSMSDSLASLPSRESPKFPVRPLLLPLHEVSAKSKGLVPTAAPSAGEAPSESERKPTVSGSVDGSSDIPGMKTAAARQVTWEESDEELDIFERKTPTKKPTTAVAAVSAASSDPNPRPAKSKPTIIQLTSKNKRPRPKPIAPAHAAPVLDATLSPSHHRRPDGPVSNVPPSHHRQRDGPPQVRSRENAPKPRVSPTRPSSTANDNGGRIVKKIGNKIVVLKRKVLGPREKERERARTKGPITAVETRKPGSRLTFLTVLSDEDERKPRRNVSPPNSRRSTRSRAEPSRHVYISPKQPKKRGFQVVDVDQEMLLPVSPPPTIDEETQPFVHDEPVYARTRHYAAEPVPHVAPLPVEYDVAYDYGYAYENPYMYPPAPPPQVMTGPYPGADVHRRHRYVEYPRRDHVDVDRAQPRTYTATSRPLPPERSSYDSLYDVPLSPKAYSSHMQDTSYPRSPPRLPPAEDRAPLPDRFSPRRRHFARSRSRSPPYDVGYNRLSPRPHNGSRLRSPSPPLSPPRKYRRFDREFSPGGYTTRRDRSPYRLDSPDRRRRSYSPRPESFRFSPIRERSFHDRYPSPISPEHRNYEKRFEPSPEHRNYEKRFEPSPEHRNYEKRFE
eukprot:Rmarinus@m.9777